MKSNSSAEPQVVSVLISLAVREISNPLQLSILYFEVLPFQLREVSSSLLGLVIRYPLLTALWKIWMVRRGRDEIWIAWNPYRVMATANEIYGTESFKGGRMSNDAFDVKLLADKLSKLNNSQQSIESLSRWSISHRKKARQIVETWEKLFNSSQEQQCISFLYLANDILQNSRRKGSEFVNEFWKVLPASLKKVNQSGDENGKKAVSRLVDIWEQRKVFGSRVHNLKEEILGRDPPPRVVSNGKSSNPVKIVKKDAQSLRIKLVVGGLLEKIVTAFHYVHDECINEEDALVKCNAAVLYVEGLVKDMNYTSAQGIQPGSTVLGQLHEQESILLQCVEQLETSMASRVALVSQLKEALDDQESNLEKIHLQLQAARSWIEAAGNTRQKLSSTDITSCTTMNASTEPAKDSISAVPATASSLQIPLNHQSATGVLQVPVHLQQPPNERATSFAAMSSATEEEKKKSAAAAVAAMLAASTSSAQMLTSVLSSLVAEEAALKNGDSGNPEKRQKVEPSDGSKSSMSGSGYFTAPVQHTMSSVRPTSGQPMSQPTQLPSSLPPLPLLPPPPRLPPTSSPANQFLQPAGMTPGPMPYAYISGSLLPPPLPPQISSSLAWSPAQQTQLQNPQPQPQQQSAAGGLYRPLWIGPYGPNHQQTSPPPVHRP
ncbi:hypothetical protein Nepgr_024809 [Nepenthes gracilis]|uniref:CID domain-containing protein n=1 Tax=Nepenthes gracilis TaxID=150966 RepID=A0AAD3Y0V5_NEPGR|nr:hypothetical protein Nepgr_024809 [Nepenthes gracilis]